MDGLPDFWELQFPDCLDPDDPTDADEDCDEDGRTNFEEYIAFTDPTVKDLAPAPAPGFDVSGAMTVSLEGKSGRTYCLMRSANLSNVAWQEVDRMFQVHTGAVQLKDTEPPPIEAYYRIVTELP